MQNSLFRSLYLRHPAAVLIAAVMVLISQTAFAATAPNITYKSGSSSPYSSANLEYTTNGTYTWTIPERVSQIKVTTVGAGGAGATASSSIVNTYYNGGGGGAITENVVINVSAGKVLNIQIGKPCSKVTYLGVDYAVSNAGKDASSSAAAQPGGAGGGAGGAYNKGGTLIAEEVFK